MKSNDWKRTAGRVIAVIVGGFVCATGINLLLVPETLVPAGLGGVAVLVEYASGVPAGALYAVFNIPLFILAWRHVDRTFALLSLVGLAAFSGALLATVGLSRLDVVRDPIVAAVFGGAISGLGGGLSLRFYGSLGGMDIIGVLVRQRLSVSVAGVGFVLNLGIVSVMAVVYGLEPAFMTMLGLAAGAWVFDRVLTGLGLSKAVLVISDRPDDIADSLIHELRRGVTFLEGEGAFRRTRKRLVYCVVTQRQLADLKRIVRRLDPGAFVTVLDANEVIGEGFLRNPGD